MMSWMKSERSKCQKWEKPANKFNEIILSDDDFDSVVIENKEKTIDEKANLFEQKVAKFTSSYEYKSKLCLICFSLSH